VERSGNDRVPGIVKKPSVTGPADDATWERGFFGDIDQIILLLPLRADPVVVTVFDIELVAENDLHRHRLVIVRIPVRVFRVVYAVGTPVTRPQRRLFLPCRPFMPRLFVSHETRRFWMVLMAIYAIACSIW
jgi:hypothetical protein